MTLRPALLLVPMLLLACPALAQHARLTNDDAVHAAPLADSSDAASPAAAAPLPNTSSNSTAQAPAHTSAAPVADHLEDDVTASPAPLATVVSPPLPQDRAVGDATRRLLQLQASGQAAAPALPQLGQSASAAYQRYMKSFEHPIPDFFDSTVPGEGGGGSR